MEDRTTIPKKSILREYAEVIAITIVVAFGIKIFVVDAYRIPTGSMERTLVAGDYILVNKFIYGPSTPRTIPFSGIEIPSYRFPGFKKPGRGDVVVFKFPGERDEIEPGENLNYIKRMIGLPGDTVEIRDRIVYVNGTEFPSFSTLRNTDRRLKPRGRQDLRIFPNGSDYNEDNYGPVYVPRRGDTLHVTKDNFKQWHVFIQRDGASIELHPDGSVSIDGAATDRYVVSNNYYFTLGDNRDNSLDSRFWGYVPEENIIGRAMLIYWSWQQEGAPSAMARIRNIRTDRIGTLIR
jgi:signal peptidase I